MKPIVDIEAQTDLTGKITGTSLALHVVARLADFYVEAGYGSEPESFKEAHFRPMYEDSTMHATELEQRFYARLEEGQPVAFLDLLLLSCAYCIEAIRADDSPNISDTWINASFAQYWLGFASGSRLVGGTAALALSENAKAGPRARDEKWAELRALARQIAASQPYKNRTTAARAALPEVTALAKTLGAHMTKDAGVKRIVSWLKGMSFEDDRKP